MIDLVTHREWGARKPRGSYGQLTSTRGVKVHYTGGHVNPAIVGDGPASTVGLKVEPGLVEIPTRGPPVPPVPVRPVRWAPSRQRDPRVTPMPDLPPPKHQLAVPVTAKKLRTAAAADKGKSRLVLVPAIIGNAQAAKTAMDSQSKTLPSHLASTFAAGQDRVGNAAVAGAAMRAIPMAVPMEESHPGR